MNPLVNSYKRLDAGIRGTDPYCMVRQKPDSPLIRIPATRGEETRIELRSPDPACNPYLALAICLAAGLDGIKNKIVPPDAMEGNMHLLTPEELEERGIESLPKNLQEAVEEFEKDPLMKEVLGEEVCGKYSMAKKKEWEDYNATVSQWEIDSYLLRI